MQRASRFGKNAGILTVFLPLILAAASAASAPDDIRGFDTSHAAQEREWERQAKASVDAGRVRQYVEKIAAEPHNAGAPGSKAVAEYLLRQLRSWGIEAEIEVFEALLPTPTKRILELLEPGPGYSAKLKEPALAEDSTSGEAGQLPTFNAYAASGDVTAPLVYVNYGTPEDYEYLKKIGISVAGKVVIARYGSSWRGIKAKMAQSHGAVACLIYSDPMDDGYQEGDPYPKGAMRPRFGVQRGSVMDMPLYPGDPLSPGWASEKGGRRLSRAEAESLMKIPVLPISYEDAQPLLERLEGPVAPKDWRGAMPFTYHVGPGPAKVRLAVDFDWSTRPIYNVIGKIPGSVHPDQWVIYGNHHDAWVNGAYDPASGAAVVLETARVLASLRRRGWKPDRTVVFALWDAEEYGLIGSTEWVEKHAEELSRKSVVYINSDSNSKGTIDAGGSHSLEQFTEEVLRDVRDPDSTKSVLEAAYAKAKEDRGKEKCKCAKEDKSGKFELEPLGAGSDYVAFLDFDGIASLTLGFSRSGTGGIYHSIYDSLDWYKRFGDPDFRYGAALSQVVVTAILRLSDAPILPFEFLRFTATVKGYVKELQKLAKEKSGQVDLSAIETELQTLEKSAAAYEAAYQRVIARQDGPSTGRLREVNATLYRTERALASAGGLPGREWYKHRIYAPGLLTGYSVKTLPGVREAIEAKQWTEASEQAAVVAKVLRELNVRITEVTAMLQTM